MHDLFKRVLLNKSLSKAGELFSLDDETIIQELPDILSIIRDTISTPDFLSNHNDQSLIEICIARLTSALRETRSIEIIAPHLVSLLRTCLSYNLRPTASGEDPPHAKIASDILSCLFLNYNKKRVMKLTIPLSVKFLHKGNKELSRNMSSYLSLAAIENGEMLALHLQPIIDSVITGNYSLARVLPQIYSISNKELIIDHAMTLVSLLPNCDRSGKLALLSLFALIAKDSPSLLESSVPQISEGLLSSTTAQATLNIFYNMISVKVSKPLMDLRSKFKDVGIQFHSTIPLVSQILTAIALFKQDYSVDTVDYLLSRLHDLEVEQHAVILKELAALVARYPTTLLNEHLLLTRLSALELNPKTLSSTKAYIQELRTNLSMSKHHSSTSLKHLLAPNICSFKPETYHSITKLHSMPGLDTSSKSMSRLLTSSQSSVPQQPPTNKTIMHCYKPPITTLHGGASSPTKSMSSGSVPFMENQQVVTVNVSQINQDLIRQVSSVQSYKDIALLQVPRRNHQGGTPTAPSTFRPGVSSSYQSISHHEVPQTSSASLRKSLSNTLPNQRRKKVDDSRVHNGGSSLEDHSSTSNGQIVDHHSAHNISNNRISIFEPYPLRDTVQHFCEKHLTKIKSYMESLNSRLPLPVKCTIEERKGKKIAKLHFACQGRLGDYCLYRNTFYSMKTRNPKIWIHFMFLSLQARSTSALSTRESSVSSLKNCWEILKYDTLPFVTLVTSAFPLQKEQDNVLQELRSNRFFDVFEYNGPKMHWGCFLCNHPERATCFVQEQEPVIEGQLKEKKGGRWKVFKKWKSRYFTLSGAKLSYKESVNGTTGLTQSLDVGSIRSVKVSRNGKRNIPKAFEIFTNERTFVLKAKDGSNAKEWIQCLSVAKARSQVVKAKSNSSQTL